MNVDLPSEVYDAFKEACAKNHTLLKDEIFKMICASLDGVAPTEKEFSPPFLEPSVKKEDLDAELKPIREKLDGLEPTDLSSIRQDIDYLKGLLERSQDCPKLPELDQKFKAIANFLENHIYLLMKQLGANPCAEDIQGLAVLRNEKAPSTEGLDKRQLKDLFLKQMKTKVF